MNDPADFSHEPEELSQADERALDALLKEVFSSPHRGSPPHSGSSSAKGRDFTDEVLARLHQSHQSVCRGTADASGSSYKTNWAIAAALTAALAASVLAMVYLRGQGVAVPFAAGPPTATGQGDTAQADPAQLRLDQLAQSGRGSEPLAAGTDLDTPPGPAAQNDAGSGARPPRRPPVVLSHGPENRDAMEAAGQGTAATAIAAQNSGSAQTSTTQITATPLLDGSLADFDRQFVTYWKAIGVTPAPVINQSAWLQRVAERFGAQAALSLEQQGIEDVFSDEQACEQLAERLIDQLILGLSPSPQRREQLVREATEVILHGGRFDHWLRSWVIDEDWIQDAMDGREQDPAALGQWMASRVLGTDAQCARCHDSPIDSRYVQHDYWALAALYAPTSKPEVFYELPDGRQRVATAAVPVRWLGLPGDAPQAQLPASREVLGELIVGNRQVARTLANHLWTIGFGMPLVAQSSSPLAPPRDDALDQALAMLADRLISEDFDLRAVARWVVACDPMMRSVPEDFLDDGWQLAGESRLAAASLAQRSFAAAKVSMPQANQNQLLAMMQSRGRLTPNTIVAPDTLLAQPLTIDRQPSARAAPLRRDNPPGPQRSGGSSGKSASAEDRWWSQWLADREGLRGGWLESIRDTDQQLRHAFYAAGYSRVDEQQLRAAESLVAATQETPQQRSEAVAQIHWILQHAK